MDIHSESLPEAIHALCRKISAAGGSAWLVGGCVRDLLLGMQPKDFDVEVYGLDMQQLEDVLHTLGRTEHVGRHFGVHKLWMGTLEIDVALPRSEHKSGSGHRGFNVATDPNLSPEQASRRRDFCMNAIMYNPIDNRMLDFNEGIKDLENRRLRHISSAFSEDPLRPLRAMQFAARFRLSIDHDTAKLCKSLLAEAGTLSRERIWGEWKKWSHSQYPSYGLQLLNDNGWLALYPEMQAMIGCNQDARWHPEGDVWVHTLQVCDQAARIARHHELDERSTEVLLFASLCHDFGKPAVTCTTDSGRICSPGHSEAGIPAAEQFLNSIGAPGYLLENIRPLVLEHISHLHGKPTQKAVRRLACRLEPSNIELWEMLVEADASGRHPATPSRPALAWLEEAKVQHTHLQKPAPLLTGKILMEMGVPPGPAMGEVLKSAYEAQIDGSITDENSATAWYKKHSNRANTQE